MYVQSDAFEGRGGTDAFLPNTAKRASFRAFFPLYVRYEGISRPLFLNISKIGPNNIDKPFF